MPDIKNLEVEGFILAPGFGDVVSHLCLLFQPWDSSPWFWKHVNEKAVHPLLDREYNGEATEKAQILPSRMCPPIDMLTLSFPAAPTSLLFLLNNAMS